MRRARIEVYRDQASAWRWRFVAPNGRIMADSAEGYSRKRHAVRAAERFAWYLSEVFRVQVIPE